MAETPKKDDKPDVRKTAVRVAMGYDGLAGLHQQIGRVLAGLRAATTAAKEKH